MLRIVSIWIEEINFFHGKKANWIIVVGGGWISIPSVGLFLRALVYKSSKKPKVVVMYWMQHAMPFRMLAFCAVLPLLRLILAFQEEWNHKNIRMTRNAIFFLEEEERDAKVKMLFLLKKTCSESVLINVLFSFLFIMKYICQINLVLIFSCFVSKLLYLLYIKSCQWSMMILETDSFPDEGILWVILSMLFFHNVLLLSKRSSCFFLCTVDDIRQIYFILILGCFLSKLCENIVFFSSKILTKYNKKILSGILYLTRAFYGVDIWQTAISPKLSTPYGYATRQPITEWRATSFLICCE